MIYYVIYLVRPPGETTSQQTYRLSGPQEARILILLSLILDKPFLNAFRLGASTVRWSRGFHLFTTIVQILDTLRFRAPLGEIYRDNGTMFIMGSLLISVNRTFSLGVTAEALGAKIDRKSAISLQCGHFDPNFQVEEVTPTNHFCTDS